MIYKAKCKEITYLITTVTYNSTSGETRKLQI